LPWGVVLSDFTWIAFGLFLASVAWGHGKGHDPFDMGSCTLFWDCHDSVWRGVCESEKFQGQWHEEPCGGSATEVFVGDDPDEPFTVDTDTISSDQIVHWDTVDEIQGFYWGNCDTGEARGDVTGDVLPEGLCLTSLTVEWPGLYFNEVGLGTKYEIGLASDGTVRWREVRGD